MAKAVDGRSDVAKAIKSDIYNALRESLTKPQGTTKKSWAQSYIEIMLKEAKNNPSGPMGQLIARQLMTDDIIEKLDAQTDAYLARDIDFNEYRVLKTLYDKQRDVFLDEDRKKIVIGSRRIGKTELAARLLVKDALRPNRRCIFVSLKFENAIKQCYNITLDLIKSLNIPIAHESKADGEIELTNGSLIQFKGNNNKAEADKLLGYKYSCIIIDEVQTQCNLMYLIDTVFRPSLMDYEDSKMILLGTPPRVPKTACEEIWNNWKGWKKYSWSMKDNPYIHNFEQELEAVCNEKGVTRDAPFIKREFEGLFVYDTEAMVFKDYKTYKDIPSDFIPTDVAIGVDYGFSDFNSVVPLVYSRNTKRGFVLRPNKFNGATVSEIVDVCRNTLERTKRFCLDRDPDFELNHINFYCDTSDQSISYEMSTKYKLPIYNCYKHDKKMALSQLADWLRSGRIQIDDSEDNALKDEFERTVYKRDDQDNILSDIDDDTFHPDAVDALLYASRQFAYDCGDESGGQSKQKTTATTAIGDVSLSRDATLPDWLNNEQEEDTLL